jgi:hypothetical protein
MTFELQTQPAPAGLAVLGSVVELRELPFGPLMELLAKGGQHLLGASLHVDGQPIGAEALQALPGRFAAALVEAQGVMKRMHDLDRLVAIHEANAKAAAALAEEAPKG